jgi:hypothetical protein
VLYIPWDQILLRPYCFVQYTSGKSPILNMARLLVLGLDQPTVDEFFN